MMQPVVTEEQQHLELMARKPSLCIEEDTEMMNKSSTKKYRTSSRGIAEALLSTGDDDDSSQHHHGRNTTSSTHTTENSSSTVFNYTAAATTAIFLTMMCPASKMWRNNDSSSSSSSSNAGTINMTYLFGLLFAYLFVLLSFFVVYGSDPGYITCEDTMRQQQLLEESDNANYPTTTTDRTHDLEETQDLVHDAYDEHQHQQQHQHIHSTVDARHHHKEQPRSLYYYTSVWRTKYCDTCQLHPPLRSHHCKKCDRCVATFDHHCTFIGTCIGERNHCRFYTFLTFQTIGFILCISIVNSSSVAINLSNTAITWPILSVLAIKVYLYPLTFISIILWLSHSWFALCNMTSFECGKSSRIDYLSGTNLCDLPFSRGLYANLRLFCCQRDELSSSWWCQTTLFGNKTKQKHQQTTKWIPILWRPPSETMSNCTNNSLLQNKYYSCC